MDRRELYNSFLQQFPIESLGNMTLEEYTNLNMKDSFCYWLEVKTDELGSIWGYSAYKFGIYRYSKTPKRDHSKYTCDENYAWSSRLGQTAQEAFNSVKDAIVRIAQHARHAEWEEIEKINELRSIVKWKIAFLYSNEQMLPFFDRVHRMTRIASHLGLVNAGMCNRVELYRFLSAKKGDKDLFVFYDELLTIIGEKQSNKNVDSAKNLDNLVVEGKDNMETKTQPTPSKHYWWLVASPDVWKFSDNKVGEIVEFTLLNENGNKRRVYQNFLDAKAGDRVIGYASTPTLQIVALGEIAKDTDDKHLYFRKTEQLLNPIDYSTVKGYEELQNMECMAGGGRGTLFKVTEDEYQILMEIIRKENPLPTNNELPVYTDADFLREVYMSSPDLQRLKALLRNKKNVILQGAPGVGKTFTAERLAFTLMGVVDKQRVELVQFHQNYSYEDFILGYKPNDAGGFELRHGVFYRFCKKALNSPDKDFFFIIDEINRGNLSKIFGELLMLIENSYRGKEMKLAYTDEQFCVPTNLYIIGMMNTADRSLAMIDYALRRRFSFFEMRPGFDADGFKDYQASLASDTFDKAIQEVQALNQAIRSDDSLGGGFCIGHSYFCNQKVFTSEWLANVIEYDIAPMLKEYWFDDIPKYEAHVNVLRALLK